MSQPPPPPVLHYASPRVAHVGPHHAPVRARAEGTRVVIDAKQPTSFPAFCVKCGQPAAARPAATFLRYQPWWLWGGAVAVALAIIGLSLLAPRLMMIAWALEIPAFILAIASLRRPVRIAIPLCARHRVSNLIARGLVIVLALFCVACVAAEFFALASSNSPFVLILASFAAGLIAALLLWIFAAQPLRIGSRDADHIYLAGAGLGFLNVLSYGE